MRTVSPTSACSAFLRVDALSLTSLGTIAATPDERSDNCVVSCVDWYGNARPIFVGDRIFALMGYELIEASATDGRVREIARVDLLTHHFGGSGERDTLQSAKHQ